MKLKTLFITVLLILLVIIMMQNTQIVTVTLLFWDVSMSRIVLIFLALLFGFVLGYFVGRLKKRR